MKFSNDQGSVDMRFESEKRQLIQNNGVVVGCTKHELAYRERHCAASVHEEYIAVQ